MDDYSVSQWNAMVKLAEDIMRRPESYADKCRGKIMATLFYEPSTRTQMSFQTAMIRLGGSIIGFDNPGNSSVSKGENLKDTIKIVSNYADVLVMRHNQEGAARAAALSADCPVINAGDGGHLHPTQTLTDLLTLKTELGRLDNLTVGLCGDLKYGRTVHSILKALSCYKNNKFILISTPSLALPQYIKDVLHARGCEFKEAATIEEAIGECDMLYMTRIQQERFEKEHDSNAPASQGQRDRSRDRRRPARGVFPPGKVRNVRQNGADTHDAEQHDHRKSAADWSGSS